MGVYSSVRAELLSVLRGLLLAKEKGYKKLIVHVDSTNVIRMLIGTMACNAKFHAIAQRCNAKFHAIVQRCRKLVQSLDWEIKVTITFGRLIRWRMY